MATGAGKYDPECTEVREKLSAEFVLLMVAGGSKGNGFSVQSTDLNLLWRMPAILRSMATEIETDLGHGPEAEKQETK